MLTHLYLLHEDEMANARAALLVKALRGGFATHGDTCEVIKCKEFKGVQPDTELALFIGFSRKRREIMDAHHKRGVRVLILDKALIRNENKSDYNRVCMDGMTPLRYLMRERRDGMRWERLYQPLYPRRQGLSHPDYYYVYANNSQMVHDFVGLGDHYMRMRETIASMRKVVGPGPRMMYRPKRTLPECPKRAEYKLSLHPETIEECLQWARGLVTYTSNCAVNSIMRGIPTVCLRPCAASPVAMRNISELEAPTFPSDDARLQWLHNLAWCQWTDEEIEQGHMWHFIKEELRQTAWLFERDGGLGV